jgi:hypothetical protein
MTTLRVCAIDAGNPCMWDRVFRRPRTRKQDQGLSGCSSHTHRALPQRTHGSLAGIARPYHNSNAFVPLPCSALLSGPRAHGTGWILPVAEA